MTATTITQHMVLAGVIAGTANLAAGVAGPLLAPLIEMTGAAMTAGVAAHLVHRVTRERARGCPRRALATIAPRASADHRGLLAAKALHLAVSLPVPSTARQVGGSILKQLLASRVLGAVGSAATCWCLPLAAGARVLGVSRSAVESALYLRSIESAVMSEVA